jgi:hypothetical protein
MAGVFVGADDGEQGVGEPGVEEPADHAGGQFRLGRENGVLAQARSPAAVRVARPPPAGCFQGPCLCPGDYGHLMLASGIVSASVRAAAAGDRSVLRARRQDRAE